MASIATDIADFSTFVPAVEQSEQTVADLLDRLGGVPPERVLLNPPPGTAAENDVIALDDRGGPICELVDGTLVMKPMRYYESWVASRLIILIGSFVEKNKLGIVTGESGFLKLFPGRIRAPDVTFIRREKLPGGRVPHEAYPALGPTLAVEVLSPSNTKREMQIKLQEYFAAGAELAWYIDPETQSATVYTSPDEGVEIGPDGVLSGGTVLPGFELSLRVLFSESESL